MSSRRTRAKAINKEAEAKEKPSLLLMRPKAKAKAKALGIHSSAQTLNLWWSWSRNDVLDSFIHFQYLWSSLLLLCRQCLLKSWPTGMLGVLKHGLLRVLESMLKCGLVLGLLLLDSWLLLLENSLLHSMTR